VSGKNSADGQEATMGDDSKRGVYRYSEHFGRGGTLSGVFTATAAEVAAAMGRKVYFGEVLGKHSDVRTTLAPADITLMSDAPEAVAVVDSLGLATGMNPLAVLAEADEEAAREAEYLRLKREREEAAS
jgi:hypothetical protein